MRGNGINVEKVKVESGYSLVESIVALALLTTVLIPLGSFVAGLATHRISKQKIEMLALAQQTMEEAIAYALYEDKNSVTGDNKWLVTEAYKRVDALMLIEITVSRAGRERPKITLKTARLLPAPG